MSNKKKIISLIKSKKLKWEIFFNINKSDALFNEKQNQKQKQKKMK